MNTNLVSLHEYSQKLREYSQKAAETNIISQCNIELTKLGLFSEVGSILIDFKNYILSNYVRKKYIYKEFDDAMEEELSYAMEDEFGDAMKEKFGDILWYFNALCQRHSISIDDIFSEATSNILADSVSHTSSIVKIPGPGIVKALMDLGGTTAKLLSVNSPKKQIRKLLIDFFDSYLQALQAARVDLSEVMDINIRNTHRRFFEPAKSDLLTFDGVFLDEERLPDYFEIKITQRESGKSYLQWGDVFIGDPLTDNNYDSDGYRFHDVFHLAYAAILHWSPTMRSLIKQKRKSNPHIDEVQDGGRASVIEEGLTAWIFSVAKDRKFFDGYEHLPSGILYTVRQFVRGYEVEACPPYLWERAILDGYKVFRRVKNEKGGIVVGDRKKRTIIYKPFKKYVT